MSSASKGEGEALLSRYSRLYISTRQKSFLRRNVRKSLSQLIMGATISKFSTSIGANPPDQQDSMDLDHDMGDRDDADEDPRPAKRRKFNVEAMEAHRNKNQDIDGSKARAPLGQLISDNERSRGAKPGLVQPSDFYGRSKSNPGSTSSVLSKKRRAPLENKRPHLDNLLPTSPVDFTKSLRVDVEGISLKSSTEFPSETVENDADIPCRVSVGIFYCQDEDKELGTFTEICKMVKPAILQISEREDGEVIRKLVKTQPFIFLPADFFVRRKVRKPNGQWGGYENTYDFPDRSRIIVTIESTKFHIEWPALHIPAGGPVSESINEGRYATSDFQLIAKYSLFAGADRLSKIPLFVAHSHPGKPQQQQSIPYTLAIKTRWTVPNALNNAVLETAKPRPVPTRNMSPIPVSAKIPPLVSDTTEADRPEMSINDSTLASGRARRDRHVPETYDLKQLSAKAQGKSPRKQRLKEPASDGSEETTVTYSLHQGDAQEIGLKQRTVQVSGLACQFCSTTNRTVEELRLHLHTDHGHFKFMYRHGPPRVQFFIEIVKPRSGPMLDIERAKTFQLTQPKTLFDLEKYLSGETWSKARHGPQHGLWPIHLQEAVRGSSSSSSPQHSRYSSPNTPNSIEEDLEEDEEEKSPERPRKVFLVPYTTKPLYHPITKQRLIPGEELPDSDEELDESWLRQKHRDLVNDFTDVTEEEKDYINGWNSYIVPKKLTSTEYLSREIMHWVKTKKTWFVEVPSRRKEFALHMQVFILRGDIDEDILWHCLQILREEYNEKGLKEKEAAAKLKAQADATMKETASEKAVPNSRPYFSCICGKHTFPPLRIFCAGNCKDKCFCHECAAAYGRPLDRHWLCNNCFSSSS